MTSRTPLFLNSGGDPQRFQSGDTVPMIFGGVGQKVYGNVTPRSGAAQTSFDNSAPLVTEGQELWNATLTPQLIGSNMHIDFSGMIDTSKINLVVTISVFRDSTCIGFVSAGSSGYNGALPCPFSLNINDTTTSLSPVTYSCRIGISANGTWYFGKGSGASMGNVNNSGWSISEEL